MRWMKETFGTVIRSDSEYVSEAVVTPKFDAGSSAGGRHRHRDGAVSGTIGRYGQWDGRLEVVS